MSKKVLVTGGAGFLGSNLVRRLLKLGYHVVVLDNLSTGSYSNIKDLEGYSTFEFIKHDIINPINLDVDQIFNLACPASPPRYQMDPIQTMKTCVLGCLNMLELAKLNKASFLQASTSEVYGDPNIHPQIESYRGNVNPIGIRACYDEGKRCAETLCFDYKRQCGVNIKIVRIFNTYGPYMDPLDGRVVSNFIINALKGNDLEVYGNGSQTRSFCYVDDMVDGLIKMMEYSGTGPINLGNPEEFTIKELADKIVNLFNNIKIIYTQLPEDDPLRRKPDIGLAKKFLEWEPNISLDQGLQSTITYFREIQLEHALGMPHDLYNKANVF